MKNDIEIVPFPSSYAMQIRSTETVQTAIAFNSKYNVNGRFRDVDLVVGEIYVIDIENPTTKKQRKNNHRVAKILGFTDELSPHYAVIRYLDTKRRGLAELGSLVPSKLYDSYK